MLRALLTTDIGIACWQFGQHRFSAQLVQPLPRDANHVGELPDGNADRLVLIEGGFETPEALREEPDLLLARAEVLGADRFHFDRS